jgi:hypothetical protein
VFTVSQEEGFATAWSGAGGYTAFYPCIAGLFSCLDGFFTALDFSITGLHLAAASSHCPSFCCSADGEAEWEVCTC